VDADTVFDAFEARWGRWYGGVGSRLDIPSHTTVTASRTMMRALLAQPIRTV
jgi:hypothetical protein